MAGRSDFWSYDSNTQHNAGSLFRIIGGWGNVSGPGIFMLRAIVIGSANAAFFGCATAACAGLIVGTAALPFLVGSTVGFALGTFGWYQACFRQALLSLHAYPALMQLHLASNFPYQTFHTWELGAFKGERFRKGWRMKSMLVVAWLTAQPALDEIKEGRERALIEEAIKSESGESRGGQIEG